MATVANTAKATISFRAIGTAVLCVFFVSGAASLMHEIIWTRLLRHVMGNTTFSITTVLCVFMSGLAVGSYIGGRMIDRGKNPLRAFAWLEVAIGVYCLLLPGMIGATEPIYRLLYQNTVSTFYVLSLIRFVFCGLLLLLPATCMGATLPVLTRFFVASLDRVGWTVGKLYAVNTFGAVVGASAAGFLLIPNIGVSKTIYFACTLNFLVGATGFWLHRQVCARGSNEGRLAAVTTKDRGRRKKAMETEISTTFGSGALLVLLIGYALSGFAALVYEIAWTRVLSLLIGSSVYAFSMMLTAFILGLAVGSVVCARFVDRLADPLRAMAIVQAAIGVSALLVVPLLGQLPLQVTALISHVGASFWLLQMAEFGLVLSIMAVPTTLMGAAFPLATRVFVQNPKSAGRSVGTLYACNTVGSILGSFLGGFVLIPVLGIQGALLTAVLLNVATGCLFLVVTTSLTPARRWMFGSVAAVFVAVLVSIIPPWDPLRMTFGPFIQARRLAPNVVNSKDELRKIAERPKILFHEEDYASTVTVKEYADGVRVISVNAKPDASSTGDLPTQQLLAHVPLLLHPDPKDVAVIGLASGITLGSAGLHSVERLDCVEISPAMVRACRLFDEFNHRILEDSRVRVFTADGRNHLSLASRQYDVIISEPSNPWIAGVGDLFTQEFFTVCRERLTDQGIACIWLETYNIDVDSFRSVVNTFRGVFPAMTLWSTTEADVLMVGSKGQLKVDRQTLVERIKREEMSADLARIGIKSAADFLSHLIMGPEAAGRFAANAPVHTDDNALLEFAAPRVLVQNVDESAMIDTLIDYRDADLAFVTSGQPDDPGLQAVKKEVTRFIQAKEHILRSRAHTRAARHAEAIEELRAAARLNRADAWLGNHLREGLDSGMTFLAQRQYPRAADTFRQLISIDPDMGGALNGLALVLALNPQQQLRDPSQAVRLAEKACELTGQQNADYLHTLCIAYGAAGQATRAAEIAGRALEIAEESGNLALANMLRGKLERFRQFKEMRSQTGP